MFASLPDKIMLKHKQAMRELAGQEILPNMISVGEKLTQPAQKSHPRDCFFPACFFLAIRGHEPFQEWH